MQGLGAAEFKRRMPQIGEAIHLKKVCLKIKG
jgi:hypothetical protein